MQNENQQPAGLGLGEGLGPLLDSEEDPARLWAEIHRLRAEVAGPQGYATWKDAAVAERVRRVKAEARSAVVGPVGRRVSRLVEPAKIVACTPCVTGNASLH